ncbi:MAG: hypothetical protein HYS60_02905, partial [Candidatus Wildermuthbacteria bacterium]|nr:hypothetical protein [Candidatus Wildermuthbacteria bacterium]
IVSQDILIQSFREGSSQQDKELQDLQNTNKTLLNVAQFYGNQAFPSKALEKLSLYVPHNVYFTAVLFSSGQAPVKKGESRQNYSMSISLRGFAPTRDLLLAFKEGLAKDPSFQDVQFPLSNLANPSDINFSASLKYVP